MRAIVSALALCAGCWSRTPTPPRPAPSTTLSATPAIETLPGLVWYLPPAPFHPPYAIHSLAAQGDHLLLGHEHNHITLVDRTTGRTLVEAVLPRASATEDDFLAFSVTAIGDDRWIVGGIANHGRAYLVEGPQLTARALTQFDGTTDYHAPVLAVLTDAGVVVAAAAHGLLLCDRQTLAVTRVLDARPGWWDLAAFGTTAVANGPELVRVDLVTGAAAPLLLQNNRPPIAASVAAGGVVIDPRRDDLVLIDAANHETTLAGTDGFSTVDATGKRFLTWRYNDRALQIRAVPSGEVLRTVQGGARIGNPSAAIGSSIIGEFGGDELRTFDLDRGTLSPLRGGVAGWGNDIAVAPDGTVLVAATYRAWWLGPHRGAIVREEALGDNPAILNPHDAARLVIARQYRDSDSAVDVIPAPGHPVPPLPPLHYDAHYFFGDARIGVVYAGDRALRTARLATTPGGADEPFVDVSPNGSLYDVDPDARAVVAATRYARVWSAGRASPTHFELPGCNVFGLTLERGGGVRFAAWNRKVIAVWQRTTGARLGTAIELDGDIVDALWIRGHQELLVVTEAEQLIAWTPGGGARTIKLPHLVHAGVSSDGHWLALAFGGGAVALVALEPLLAALPTGAPPRRAREPVDTDCHPVDTDDDADDEPLVDPFVDPVVDAPADDDQ